MEFKYIMFDKIKYVLFPPSIEHVQMRDALRKELGACNVTSAAFVQFTTRPDGELIVDCFGHSNSLGIGFGERDAKIIHNMAVNTVGFGAR